PSRCFRAALTAPLQCVLRALSDLAATPNGTEHVRSRRRSEAYQIAWATRTDASARRPKRPGPLTVESPVLARNVSSAVPTATDRETAQRDARQTPLSRR